VYELLHGNRPWRSQMADDGGAGGAEQDQSRFNDLPISSKLSPTTNAFLHAILAPDWRVRLGCRPRKVNKDGTYSMADQRVQWDEVKAHAFFAGIDWDALYRKEIPPPFTPDNSRANCSPEADLADQLLDHKPRKISDEQQKNFVGWDFRTDLGPVKPANAWSDNSAEQQAVAGTGPVAGTLSSSAGGGTVPVVVSAANGHHASAPVSGAAAVAASAPLVVGVNGTPPVLHDQIRPSQPSPSPAPTHGQQDSVQLQQQQQLVPPQQLISAATSPASVAVAVPASAAAPPNLTSASSYSSIHPAASSSSVPVGAAQPAAATVVLVQPAPSASAAVLASAAASADPPAGGFTTVQPSGAGGSRPATSSSVSIEDR